MDFFGGQFIDIINWENPEEFLLVKKFDRPLDEIKNNSTLIVDPGYAAIFVHNGKIEAIQDTPGQWTLDTENIPFITSFKNILRGLESPDKAAVYFLKTTEISNQKWGTKNPVKYVDPVYNFPIKLRAFGNFTFKISNIEYFWTQYIGTRNEVTVDEIKATIVDRMLQLITDSFAEVGLSYNNIDSNRMEIAEELFKKVNDNIGNLGIHLTDFRIEDTNFSDDTERLIAKIAEQTANVNTINQLQNVNQQAMQNYKTTRQLDAMEKAAENEGAAGGMMGTFVGMNMGNQANAMGNINEQDNYGQNNNSGQESLEDKLMKLKNLLNKELISEEEYNEKKKDILKGF
ncbi:SPFH domain-containing protein [Candidatus Vampirococcus lugosii]|uniref:Membrane protein n=1 Tax=Candidatus Vampirococcus lugosii TaxID=2789015 RepID=A0ABS5QK28_9BACT|nr:SPFH domain-containing protein [Candidatus Vampirococcus lugosii]MBS8121605.1 membrane protein [Candidatus Vampirococcus lugosii]